MEFDLEAMKMDLQQSIRETMYGELLSAAKVEAEAFFRDEINKTRDHLGAIEKSDQDAAHFQAVVQDGATSPVNKTSKNGFSGKCVEIKISAQGENGGSWVPLGLGMLPVIYVRRGQRVVVPVEAFSVLLDTNCPVRKAQPLRDNSWEWWEEWQSRYEWTVYREDVSWEEYKAQMELQKFKRMPGEIPTGGRQTEVNMEPERDPARSLSLTGATHAPIT
jgi:hypothetical protein